MKYIIHFRKTKFLISLLVIFFWLGCSDDDGPTEPNEENTNKKNGFVINVQTPSLSHLVGYYEELPSGEVDLSSGKDFQRFFVVDIFNGALYMASPDRGEKFSKLVVNSSGEIVIEAEFPVGANPFQIKVKDASIGVFQDRATPSTIGTFNPVTMEITGSIDMSAALLPNDLPPRYQAFYFRDDLVFGALRPNEGGTYDSLGIHIANLSSGTYVSSILHGSKGAPINDVGQNHLDENGNLYIPDQGNPQIFPPAPALLHRINSGSNNIDSDYEFVIGAQLNPGNIFPVFAGFRYIGNGKAIALVSTGTPQQVLDIITNAGGFENLTNEDLNLILGVLFTAENAVWCSIDVNSKIVTPIAGLPPVSAYSTTAISEADGKLLLPIASSSEQAIYSYDLSSSETKKEFDVKGGNIIGVYNIANDFNQ
jgi:hypothetical protein